MSDEIRVVQRFLRAIEAGDEVSLQQVYHDNARIWHNFTDATVSKQQNIETLIGLYESGCRIRYSMEEELVVGSRVIRRHRVEISKRNRETVVLHVAMFATVEAGQITRLDEYMDSRQSEAVSAGLSTAPPAPPIR